MSKRNVPNYRGEETFSIFKGISRVRGASCNNAVAFVGKASSSVVTLNLVEEET